jgi:hypothetical protein
MPSVNVAPNVILRVGATDAPILLVQGKPGMLFELLRANGRKQLVQLRLIRD